jgi:alkanesulfonate monooxygenase SsuD/methylene tetrahydromethanopterin reductase-like flavin-dependent oxidoreductase (luciferase family)
MAGVTQKAKLGTMVTGVTYRYPALLIKAVTTLDVLSGGRAYLGIGAAWNEQEHLGLGVPFPPLKQRFEMLEDALKLAHQMWSDGNDAPFDGQHSHLQRSLNVPQAVTKPRPPILIGGTGEQKTLRFVAEYGDACNLFLRLGDDEVRRKLDILRGHCETAGRPYSAIDKTSLNSLLIASKNTPDGLSAQGLLDELGKAGELGFDQAIFSIRNDSDPGVFDTIASVRDQIAAIPEGGRK